MQPKDQLYDIMKRTIYNLEYIEANKDVEGPFETTQLLNSFLGAVAHPWEKYRSELDNVSLREACDQGWPMVEKENANDIDPLSLGDLIRLIRNGMAHGNITLYPDDNSEIRSIFVWNINRGARSWGAVITVDMLKDFLFKFVELAEILHGKMAVKDETQL